MNDYKKFIKNQITMDAIPEWNTAVLCGSYYSPKRNQFLSEMIKYYSKQYPNAYHVTDDPEMYLKNVDIIPTSELSSLYSQLQTIYLQTQSSHGIVIFENQYLGLNEEIISKYIFEAKFIGIKFIVVSNISILKPYHRLNIDLFIAFDRMNNITANHLCNDFSISMSDRDTLSKLHIHCQKNNNLFLLINYREGSADWNKFIKIINLKMKINIKEETIVIPELRVSSNFFNIENRITIEV